MEKKSVIQWIEKAEQLLGETRNYTTLSNQTALEDCMEDAEKTLQEDMAPVFTENRGFLPVDSGRDRQMAVKRYSFASRYLEKEEILHYGLEICTEWFQSVDLRKKSKDELMEMAKQLTDGLDSLLKEAKIGKRPGEYARAAYEKLEESQLALSAGMENGQKTELIQRIITCKNALSSFLYSRVLRGDIETTGLFWSPEDVKTIKSRIIGDTGTRREYEKIRNIAEERSFDEIKDFYDAYWKAADYEKLNRRYYLWRRTQSNISFHVPAGTACTKFRIVLSGTDNEQYGLGHAWVDDITMLGLQSTENLIRNGGFEQGGSMPDFWTAENCTGKAIVRTETLYPFCGREKRSMFLCNPSAADEACLEYMQPLQLEPEQNYTLQFSAKYDGKLKKGLLFCVDFYDRANQIIDSFVYESREMACLIPQFHLNFQADAIVWLVTGNSIYAEKAKMELLCHLNNFCQGAEYWMLTRERAEGIDASGAVQAGRLLCTASVVYSMLADSGVFTTAEEKKLQDMVEYIIKYCGDLRDRTDLTLEQVQFGCGNWHTDQWAGIGMAAIAFPKLKNRMQWLTNASRFLEAQLECYLNPDGSWPESINYHCAVLWHLALYARTMRHQLGDDWMKTTRLSQMFRYLIAIQTPPYRYFKDTCSTPPFGDHRLKAGDYFLPLFGTFASDIHTSDPELARLMYQTWSDNKKLAKELWPDDPIFLNLLMELWQPDMGKEDTLKLPRLESRADGGVHVYRSFCKDGTVNYLALHSNEKKAFHNHQDQGSFILYHHSVPVIMDPGIEGYFDISTHWYYCSMSHACMQFQTHRRQLPPESTSINCSAGNYSLRRGYEDVPMVSHLHEFEEKNGKLVSRLSIDNQGAEGLHHRSIFYDPETEICEIQDSVENFSGNLLFSLPVVADSSYIEGNSVFCHGYYGTKIEIRFHGTLKKLYTEKGRSVRFFPGEGKPTLEYVRAIADASDGFRAEIIPHMEKK